MPILKYSLKTLHTFGIDISAYKVVIAENYEHILNAWKECQQYQLPFLLLGKGSNVLFLNAFNGIVVINRIKGIYVYEDDQFWHLHVRAGENWHKLVIFALQKGIGGLENLALIPGCVGAAPIQNIGAYGVELKDICLWVDVLDLNQGNIKRLAAEQCQFGYRDSIFKHRLSFGYIIVSVGFILPKCWKPVINYGDLSYLDSSTVTPKQIFDVIYNMRCRKLPHPSLMGNAGSFFKNPIISKKQANSLLSAFPHIPHYPKSSNEIKLAAGWLIEQCQLKGYRVGDAAVYQKQSLVLVNLDNATARDIVALAHIIRKRVGKKFNIWLEPEVRFIGSNGEKNAAEVIS